MTVRRGFAALVLAGAVCAAASGARGELPLSGDEPAPGGPVYKQAVSPPGLEAVGRLSACPDKECPTHCTAFLIGPDLAATAAHCVKVEGGNWHDPARIRFHSFTHPAVRAAEYTYAGEYTQNTDPHAEFIDRQAFTGQDIAILRLEERLGDKLGWLKKGKVDWDELAGGGEYEFAGIPEETVYHLRSCRIHPEMARLWKDQYSNLRSAFERGVFFHTCYLRGGFSGGPLLRREGGKLTWIGVNSAHLTMSATGYMPVENAGMTAILLPNGKPAPLK